MYVNSGTEITNTPSTIIAGYNTWPEQPASRAAWYQPTPVYYTDVNGNVRKWDSWNPPQLMRIPGGTYNGTSTRTGGYYTPNTVIDPRGIPTRENSCTHGQY